MSFREDRDKEKKTGGKKGRGMRRNILRDVSFPGMSKSERLDCTKIRARAKVK